MRRAVIADTGPLYAMLVRSDQHHDRARAEMARLARDGLSVMMTYPTLMETYTLLLRRVHPSSAQEWALQIQRRSSCLSPTPPDYQQAIERLWFYRDQTITLFDALTAVLSDHLDVSVWTFDAHFDILGASVWR